MDSGSVWWFKLVMRPSHTVLRIYIAINSCSPFLDWFATRSVGHPAWGCEFLNWQIVSPAKNYSPCWSAKKVFTGQSNSSQTGLFWLHFCPPTPPKSPKFIFYSWIAPQHRQSHPVQLEFGITFYLLIYFWWSRPEFHTVHVLRMFHRILPAKLFLAR